MRWGDLLHIAYLDDNKTELDTFSHYIHKYLHDSEFFPFTNEEEFFSDFVADYYDVIFLDIYLTNTTGIEIAKRIRNIDRNVKIAFCTTSNDFASESYEVNASYYLLKPFSQNNIDRMLKRINLDKIELSRTIEFSDGQYIVVHNITYTEYYCRSIIVHLNNSNDISLKITQSELENKLCDLDFFICCSKGILVNMNYIIKISNNTIYLSNDISVPISRRNQKKVISKYSNFRLNKM